MQVDEQDKPTTPQGQTSGPDWWSEPNPGWQQPPYPYQQPAGTWPGPSTHGYYPPSEAGSWGSDADPQARHQAEGRFRRLLTARMTGWLLAAVLAATVAGLAVSLAATPSLPASRNAVAGPFPGGNGFFGGFAGGAFGTVDSVSSSSFTITERTGETITVDETSSTTYRSGTGSASASAVTPGARVIVQGSTSGSTITATEVTVLPSGGFGPGVSGSNGSLG